MTESEKRLREYRVLCESSGVIAYTEIEHINGGMFRINRDPYRTDDARESLRVMGREEAFRVGLTLADGYYADALAEHEEECDDADDCGVMEPHGLFRRVYDYEQGRALESWE